MLNHKELVAQIGCDGFISKEEVLQIKEAFSDECSRVHADSLFQLKDRLRIENIDPSFVDFFIEYICTLLLEDDTSPGEIDEAEARWLRARIERKGYADVIDTKLLNNLYRKAITFPAMLHIKRRNVRRFELLLFSSRFIAFLAVLGSILSSIALFLTSSQHVWYGIAQALNHDQEHQVTLRFVEAIDGYLFATVLLIFGIGLYSLFIHEIDPLSMKLTKHPSWLNIKSIDDLKSSLGRVIVMILIVMFFKSALNVPLSSIQDLLWLGLSTLLVSAALYLTHAGHKKE